MFTEVMAKELVQVEMGPERKVSLYKQDDKYFMFMCENHKLTPSRVLVVVDKATGKTGSSFLSVEEAISRIGV